MPRTSTDDSRAATCEGELSKGFFTLEPRNTYLRNGQEVFEIDIF
jgi:hypothetical protein